MSTLDEFYQKALAATSQLSIGTRILLVKGCKARELGKGTLAQIQSIEPLGAEYSHAVRVVFKALNGFRAGKTFVFFARHPNRLNDTVVRMNDGNPLHSIEVKKR